MSTLSVRALSPETWGDFEKLVESNNGVWGGCWCTWFHGKVADGETNQCRKRRLVDKGKAHAALVYDGEECVGWCQFGAPEELPNIYHKKQAEAMGDLPDWRITCLFVDKSSRRRGVSGVALRGALSLIQELGGGVIEAYPQDVLGKKVSASFLYNGTRTQFEAEGFELIGTKGKNHCVMRKVV